MATKQFYQPVMLYSEANDPVPGRHVIQSDCVYESLDTMRQAVTEWFKLIDTMNTENGVTGTTYKLVGYNVLNIEMIED